MEQLSCAKFQECLGGLLEYCPESHLARTSLQWIPGTMHLSRQDVADSNCVCSAPKDASAANDYNVVLAVARADRATDAPADAPADAHADATADATSQQL